MRTLVFAAALAVLGGCARVATAADNRSLQDQLRHADKLYNLQMWDEAIAEYRAIQTQVPALTVTLLQIGSAYRNKKDYDAAIAAYKALLATGANDEARIGIAYAYIEKSDLRAAEESLLKVSRPTREVLYNIGELKLAQDRPQDAATWYRKAMRLDPSWDKPAQRLALAEASTGARDSRPAIAVAGGGSR